ncbi:MAG: FtsX-like permease family protein [Myxococcota bacterium]
MSDSSTVRSIAFVHLTSRAKQTLIAMLSVVFGVSVYVFMNSFMTGVNDLQNDLAFSTLAHIRVSNDEPSEPRDLYQDAIAFVHSEKKQLLSEGVRNATETIDTLRRHPEVQAIAPEVNFAGTLQSGSIRLEATVSGVEAARADAVFDASEYTVEGSWRALATRPDGIVLGVTLAENLGVGLGEGVLVSNRDGVQRNLRVIGISKYSIESVDGRKAFIHIGTARQMSARNSDFASDLQIRLTDFDRARQVATRLESTVEYTVEPWQAASGQLEAGSQLRDIIALAVSAAILIVAGFGIYNIMNMTVSERLREIAILNAMGFNSRDIVQIFLLQAVIIGLVGGLGGLSVGYALSAIIDDLPFPVASLGTYPIAYEMSVYVMALVAGLSTTFVAGFLPAYKASRVDPVAILRGT